MVFVSCDMWKSRTSELTHNPHGPPHSESKSTHALAGVEVALRSTAAFSPYLLVSKRILGINRIVH